MEHGFGDGGVPSSEATEDPRNRRWSGFWLGMKLHLIVAIPVLLLAALMHRLGPAAATFCLWQWFYLVPAIVNEFTHDRPKRARGVLAAGLVTMAIATLLFFLTILILCFGPLSR